MATNEENLQLIVDIEKEIINNNEISKQECKEQIILLETAKEKFQEPAAILDRALYKQVSEVNDKREALADAYGARLGVCKSDLFWRYAGFTTFPDGLGGFDTIYTLKCTKLTKYFDSDDLNPSSVTRADSWTGTAVTFTSYSLQDVGGGRLKLSNSFAGVAELEDRDGLKVYSEPYTVDLLDTLVAESYGTIGFQSSFLTLLTPNEGDVTDISIGNIVSIDPNPFSPELSAAVIGVGTTQVDLSIFPTAITGGISTTNSTVPYIEIDTLSNFDFSETPLDSGEYPFFQFSISPDEVENKEFAVDFEDSPYEPQTITTLEFESIEKANKKINGNGVRIEKTNAGYDTKTAKWDHFLEGLPNPNDLDETVEEPLVAAGQQLYILGFDERPLKQNGNPASEGDVYEIDTSNSGTFPSSGLYESLPSCSSTLNNNISTAESEKNSAVNTWTNSDVVDSRIQFSNLLKDEINDLNLRIWSLRIQLGDTNSTIKKKSDFNELVVSSDLIGLLNNPDEI